MRNGYLRLLVFWGGLVTLGAELAASRLLAPYFGTSLIVWSSLIGLILVCLAAGYWFGGIWADRSPRLETLLVVVTAAAIAVALVPVLARPVLSLSLTGFASLKWGMLLGSFVGVLVLLGIPMVLLGCITPFALRLYLRNLEEAGKAAGQLFACSTLGSFVGSFLPVMVLIPAWGTRNTYVFFSVTLLAVVALGALVIRRPGRSVTVLLAMLGVGALGSFVAAQPLRADGRTIYEGESRYHYIHVVTNDLGWTHLQLNEGIVTHSAYHPGMTFTGGEWDYFTVAPFFHAAPFDALQESQRWAIIGLGAGTTARLITYTYGPVPIDGVELDPDIIEVGRTYFGMTFTNLHAYVGDGRPWLTANTNTYDVVGIDAYRQPYIPFELTTVEFFQLVSARLSERGVVAINVGRTAHDLRLVDALAATMQQVFPSVALIDLHHLRNTVIVAAKEPVTPADFIANAQAVSNSVLRLVGRRAAAAMRLPAKTGLVLTDDRAPVERLMDLLVTREILGLMK